MNDSITELASSWVSVSLYIHGLHLDPTATTATLGVQPTEARMAGESRILSSGRKIIQKNGLWVFRIRKENGDIESMVDELSSIFAENAATIEELSGLEEAYLDIFVSYSPSDKRDSKFEAKLSRESIKTIALMNLPVQFTCAVTMT